MPITSFTLNRNADVLGNKKMVNDGVAPRGIQDIIDKAVDSVGVLQHIVHGGHGHGGNVEIIREPVLLPIYHVSRKQR